MFFELLIPPEPFIQDEPHFFCHKFNKIIANLIKICHSSAAPPSLTSIVHVLL